MAEIIINIHQNLLEEATREECRKFLADLMLASSLLITRYGASVNVEDSFRWVVCIPDEHEPMARKLLNA